MGVTWTLIALLAQNTGGIVTDVTPAMVAQAIAEARAAKDPPVYQVSRWMGALYCGFSTPYSRVLWAARRAKKEYKDFTAADLDPGLVGAGEVRFYCGSAPLNPSGTQRANVQAIVITGKDGTGEVIKPLALKQEAEEFSNAYGARIAGGGAVATFPLDALKPGRELHVVYDHKVAAHGKSGFGVKTCDDCSMEIKLDNVR